MAKALNTQSNIELIQEKVIFELKNLRKIALPEEIEELVKGVVHPSSNTSCIYGLMTGNCFSPRASSLIYHCANGISLSDITYNADLYKLRPSVKNGKNSYKRNPLLSGWLTNSFTPLEWWISYCRKDIPKIVRFLTNKNIKTIKLSKDVLSYS